MFKRVENITEKLKDPTVDTLLRIDKNSWSEAEKALFLKVNEVEEEFLQKGNEELLLKDGDLIYKSIEVMYKRITDLYCYTIPKAISGLTAIDHEIVNHFFQLHFGNFETDLLECILNLQKWEESDRQKFLCDLKKYGSLYFRIPRGFKEESIKAQGSASDSGEPANNEDKSKESQRPSSS